MRWVSLTKSRSTTDEFVTLFILSTGQGCPPLTCAHSPHNFYQGCQIWKLNRVRLAPNGTNLTQFGWHIWHSWFRKKYIRGHELQSLVSRSTTFVLSTSQGYLPLSFAHSRHDSDMMDRLDVGHGVTPKCVRLAPNGIMVQMAPK